VTHREEVITNGHRNPKNVHQTKHFTDNLVEANKFREDFQALRRDSSEEVRTQSNTFTPLTPNFKPSSLQITNAAHSVQPHTSHKTATNGFPPLAGSGPNTIQVKTPVQQILNNLNHRVTLPLESSSEETPDLLYIAVENENKKSHKNAHEISDFMSSISMGKSQTLKFSSSENLKLAKKPFKNSLAIATEDLSRMISQMVKTHKHKFSTEEDKKIQEVSSYLSYEGGDLIRGKRLVINLAEPQFELPPETDNTSKVDEEDDEGIFLKKNNVLGALRMVMTAVENTRTGEALYLLQNLEETDGGERVRRHSSGKAGSSGFGRDDSKSDDDSSLRVSSTKLTPSIIDPITARIISLMISE